MASNLKRVCLVNDRDALEIKVDSVGNLELLNFHQAILEYEILDVVADDKGSFWISDYTNIKRIK